MSDRVWEEFLDTPDGTHVEIYITQEGPNSYTFTEGPLPHSVTGISTKYFQSRRDAIKYARENYIPGRRSKGWIYTRMSRRFYFKVCPVDQIAYVMCVDTSNYEEAYAIVATRMPPEPWEPIEADEIPIDMTYELQGTGGVWIGKRSQHREW